ncbi:MAG TPA: bacillithiol system redox-active protein YtxJ [Gemmatimonadaceae bacterium]
MHPDLIHLHTLEALDRLLADSHARPLLLFKHSYTCGISAEALDELVDHLNADVLAAGMPEPQYAMVTVQTDREISNAVSRKLGVRHETPQALLVRDGRVIWSASHFRVTADALKKALNGQPEHGRGGGPR